jgi:hypothetical protein
LISPLIRLLIDYQNQKAKAKSNGTACSAWCVRDYIVLALGARYLARCCAVCLSVCHININIPPSLIRVPGVGCVCAALATSAVVLLLAGWRGWQLASSLAIVLSCCHVLHFIIIDCRLSISIFPLPQC